MKLRLATFFHPHYLLAIKSPIHEESFHWGIGFAISLMAKSLDFISAYYKIFDTSLNDGSSD